MSDPAQPLSTTELDQLDEFLADPALEETSMDVAVLDGYLTALLISPRLVVPEVWLARVWDMENAKVKPKFAGAQEVARMQDLIMRHYDALAVTFANAEPILEPVFQRGAQWGVSEWCAGFLLGTSFDRDTWAALMEQRGEWFAALHVLGMGDEEEIEEEFAEVETAFAAVIAAVRAIDGHWRAQREGNGDNRATSVVRH